MIDISPSPTAAVTDCTPVASIVRAPSTTEPVRPSPILTEVIPAVVCLVVSPNVIPEFTGSVMLVESIFNDSVRVVVPCL